MFGDDWTLNHGSLDLIEGAGDCLYASWETNLQLLQPLHVEQNTEFHKPQRNGADERKRPANKRLDRLKGVRVLAFLVRLGIPSVRQPSPESRKIIALLISTQTKQLASRKVPDTHVIPLRTTKYIHAMLKLQLDRLGALDATHLLHECKPSTHIRTGFVHAPEDSGVEVEIISLPPPMAQFRFESGYRSFSSLDGVKRSLVLSIVGGFVV